MKKWFKDWSPLPADMLIQVLLPVIFIIIGVLASILLPVLQRVRRADSWSVFGVAVAASIVGVVLLFLARLPLYRQRQFFTFGPRLLDASHRRLYWLAYIFVAVSVFLLLSLLAVLR
jgi:hypothetical protein